MESRVQHRLSLVVGLIGAGIQASRTPLLHEQEAAAQGLRYVYKTIDLDQLGLGREALPDLLTAAERMGFAGLNITYPCKQSVIPLLHELSDDARARIGQASRPGSAVACRTRRSARLVQLGAGGAGSAVGHAAMMLGVGTPTIFDIAGRRAHAVADALCARFGAGLQLPART